MTPNSDPSILDLAAIPMQGGARRVEGAAHGAPVSMFVVDSEPGQGADPHVHPYQETFVVLDGAARFTVGDQTLDVRAPAIVVAPADVPHRFVNLGPGRLRSVNIHPTPTMQTEYLEA